MQAVIYDQIANRPMIEMRWEKVYFPQNSFLILKKNFLLISRLRRSFAHNNYQKFQIANTPTSPLALKVNQELEVAVLGCTNDDDDGCLTACGRAPFPLG